MKAVPVAVRASELAAVSLPKSAQVLASSFERHPGGRWERRARGRDGGLKERTSRLRGKGVLFKRCCRSTRQEGIQRKGISGRHGGHSFLKA